MGFPTLETVLSKIKVFQGYSVDEDLETSPFFPSWITQVKGYYSKGYLKKPLTDVIRGLYTDISTRHRRYADGFKPSLSNSYPSGYSDVSVLFYDFGDVLTLDAETFYTGFVREIPQTAEGEAPAAPVITKNTFIDSCVAKMNSFKSRETSALEAVHDFCVGDNDSTLYMLTEDYQVVSEPLSKEQITDEIYINRKVLEVDTTFNIGVYVPKRYK